MAEHTDDRFRGEDSKIVGGFPAPNCILKNFVI